MSIGRPRSYQVFQIGAAYNNERLAKSVVSLKQPVVVEQQNESDEWRHVEQGVL